MKLMVEYLNGVDYDFIEFKTVEEAYTFYNNNNSDVKRLWFGKNIMLEYTK